MSGSIPGRPRGATGAAPRVLPPTRNMPAPSRARLPPTPGQLARRRLFVRLGKWLMPVLAVALLTVVAFWPEIEGGDDHSRVSFRRTVQTRAEALRVVSPRYQGVDDMNRPYTVTATVGQQVGAAEILDLEQPRADILLNDGHWIYLRADAGRYDKPDGRLDLRGDVTIYHDDGTMMRTASAVVRLEEGNAAGDDRVAAQGPFGTLTSDGFRLFDRGVKVIFTGLAHAVLESRE